MSLPASVSAVLPAYNEAEIIADVIDRTGTALIDNGVDSFEIVVVDDGSVDGTASAVEALVDRLPIRLVRHHHNRGYGAALRSGFETAGGEAIWLMDSDGQFDPADLKLLLPCYRPDRMVAGYRAHRRDSLLRRLYHRAFFGLVRLLLGQTARDVNCAFKLFPRALGVGLSTDGAMISTELILRARRAGFGIAEIAVLHYPRLTGQATGANLGVVARAFAELWQLMRHRAALRTLEPPSRTQ